MVFVFLGSIYVLKSTGRARMGGDDENRPKLCEPRRLGHKVFFEILRCKDCNETRVCLEELRNWELVGRIEEYL